MERQPHAAVQDRPAHTGYHAAEVLRRIRSRMVGRNLDEQVDGHSEQELNDQGAERKGER
jgi:hypothetical protein